MDCPICQQAMFTAEFNEVEIDLCISCEGIWLDAGELELLSEQSILVSCDHAKTPSELNEPARKCPICGKVMRKIIADKQTPPVCIDCCPAGHGLWFDKNELQHILQTAPLEKHPKIKASLAGLFGLDTDSSTPINH